MNINSGHLYLLRSLLRTRILMIHMVFWEVLASLVPLRLPKPVCIPFPLYQIDIHIVQNSVLHIWKE